MSTPEAYFAFDCPPEKDTFIFKLRDSARIQEARNLLSGKEQRALALSGIIIKKPASYNLTWSFHLDPASITFTQMHIEVCSATIRYVADHIQDVGGAFLPQNRWCPWRFHLLKEVSCEG